MLQLNCSKCSVANFPGLIIKFNNIEHLCFFRQYSVTVTYALQFFLLLVNMRLLLRCLVQLCESIIHDVENIPLQFHPKSLPPVCSLRSYCNCLCCVRDFGQRNPVEDHLIVSYFGGIISNGCPVYFMGCLLFGNCDRHS